MGTNANLDDVARGVKRAADYRELVIVDLADENAMLREHVASLEADIAIYHELTVAAFDALRELTGRHKRLQESSQQLRAAYETLSVELLLHAGAADDEAA